MKALLLSLCLMLGVLQTFISSNQIQVDRSLIASHKELFYLPSANVLRLATFDFDDLTADLIWVKSILYFSDEFLGARSYAYLETLLNLVTDLDPRFEKAYIWGGSAFIYNGQSITAKSINKSTRLLQKGWDYYNESLVKWKTSDEFWRIPFMIGFNYGIELRDKGRGAPYMQAAARFPQVPDYIRNLASTFYRKAGSLEKAVDSLEEEQLTLENLRLNLRMAQTDQQKADIDSRIRSIYKQAADKGISLASVHERQQQMFLLYRDYLTNFSYLPVGFFQLIHSPEHPPLPPLLEGLRQ